MEYEIKPAEGLKLNLREVWQYRELIYYFTLRDIQIKYKQTVLGASWAILQPFLLMIVFTVFFSSRINIHQSYAIPYPLFLYMGLMIWTTFANGLSNSANSMVTNSNIIKKIYFPRLIIPLSNLLATFVDFAMTLILFIGLLLYYHQPVDILRLLLLLPVSLLLTFITTFGVGSFIAAVNVKYRDFRYIVPFMIQILLFLSPVIYPISSTGLIERILTYNPIAVAIELFRASITGAPIDYHMLMSGSAIAVIFLLVGLAYFKRTEYYFADLA